jgi:hypothetical protein
MPPLPYSDASAAVGFFVLVAAFMGGEEFLIIRTLLRHDGTRADRGTHLLSSGCVVVGVGGAFALAGTIHEASLHDVRWAGSVRGRVRSGLRSARVPGCGPRRACRRISRTGRRQLAPARPGLWPGAGRR